MANQVNSNPSHSSICILSSDRIFASLLAGLFRNKFHISVAPNAEQVESSLERERMTLVLADANELTPSLISTLNSKRKTASGFPHILIFLSSGDTRDILARCIPIADRVFTKPPGTEEIMRAVLEMTMT
jgi:DNA-binding response OmpR family regulator